MLEYVVMSKFIGHSSEVTGQPPGALSVKEDADMTAATQGLTGSGVPATQQPGGLAPGFPAPIGAEQYPGFTNWSGVQAPLAFQSPHQAQQIVQQLLAQILPIAQQTMTQHGPAPFTGQQPGLPWAQPTVPQYPSAGLFGQVNRPFSALS